MSIRTRALLSASSVIVIMASGTSPVQAQDSNALETVIVTGTYAKSLEMAMDIKRDSPVIVDAISFSDLGQLPGVSIADALARLPATTAERDPNNGAASQIAIRGMPEELTLGTLNGRDIATTTPDRNVRYDQFPTDLIGGATVFKSPMASLDEGGIAGSVEMKTIHPLDFKANTIIASMNAAYSPLGGDLPGAGEFGWRGSLSYIGKFFDDKLGVAVGWAQRAEPYQWVRTDFVGYDPTENFADLNGDGVNDTANYGAFHAVAHGTDKRKGAVAIVEWRPNGNFHVYIDGFYSRVNYYESVHGLQTYTANAEWTNTFTNVAVADNKIVAGTVTEACTFGCPTGEQYGLTLQNISAFSARNDNFYSLGGNAEWNVTDNDTITADFGWSHVHYLADYGQILTDNVNLTGGVPDHVVDGQSLTFDARHSPAPLSVNVNLADPNRNRISGFTVPFYEDGRDTIYSTKLDYKHDFGPGFFSAFSMGVRYVDRSKSNVKLDQSGSIAVTSQTVMPVTMILPDARGSYDGSQKNQPHFLAFDFNKALSTYFGAWHPTQSDGDKTGSWVVGERTLAGYAQVDYKGHLFGEPFAGNIGVRVVSTNDTSSSTRQDGVTSAFVPYTVKNDFTDVLPSFNFSYTPSERWVIRVAAAEAVSRPAMDDLNAGFTTYCPGGPGVGCQAFGGNPSLKPFKDKQVDVAAEYYYSKNSYAAAAVYYKDLDTWITTSQQTITVAGVSYQAFQPVNQHGGYIRGYELTLQNQFDFLPSPFDGLGLYANYAWAESNIVNTENFSLERTGLIGLSKSVYTATLYFDKDGFDTHISYSFRSDFPRNLDGGGFAINDGEGSLGAQASYAFDNGIALIVEGSNLTNTPYETSYSNGAHGRYQEFGRMFYFGIRYRN